MSPPRCRPRTCRSRVLRSEEHTSELQSLRHLVCRLLLEKKTPEPAAPYRPASNEHLVVGGVNDKRVVDAETGRRRRRPNPATGAEESKDFHTSHIDSACD